MPQGRQPIIKTIIEIIETNNSETNMPMYSYNIYSKTPYKSAHWYSTAIAASRAAALTYTENRIDPNLLNYIVASRKK
jgi:hypothetical protein